MRRVGCRGWTLVEMLIVLAVIGVLIAILVPVLSRAKATGVRIKCAANLRTFGQALSVYRSDHEGRLPEVELIPDVPAGDDALIGALGSYVDAPKPISEPSGGVSAHAPWHCPADPSVAARYGMSYQYDFNTLLLAYQADGFPKPYARALRYLDDRPTEAILTDASPPLRSATGFPDPWHDGPGDATRNILHADSSVDWLR